MPDENEQKKERSKVSIRIGDAQVELEGTYDNIKKLMGKELVDFTKGLEETTKQLPSSTEIAPKITPKTPEVSPKEKTMPPPSKPSTTPETLIKSPPVSTIGKPTEKMVKKRIVSRNAAIALVLMFIVLLAGLVSVIAIYVPMVSNLESQITEKDNTISSLNTQLAALQSTLGQVANEITTKDSQIAALNSTISGYNAAILDYRKIILLQASGLLYNQEITQDASNYTVIWNNPVEYAGYVTVAVQSSSNTTYVETVYSSYGVNFDYNMTVGTSETAAFPVLPGLVEIRVGNTELAGTITAAITATYYY